MTTTADDLREKVRRRYAESASGVLERGRAGCGDGSRCPAEDTSASGEAFYDARERDELPDAAVLASLGCGNPTAVAELREGETVLDLGSGGGIDVILSARRVGSTGHRVRPRHDGRDARARAAERARRGCDERRLPARGDRGHPAAERVGRRRDLELCDQPVDGQGRGADRDRACPEAGRPARDQRHRRRGPPLARTTRRARLVRRLHRRRALAERVRGGSGRGGLRGRARRAHARGGGRDARRDSEGGQGRRRAR